MMVEQRESMTAAYLVASLAEQKDLSEMRTVELKDDRWVVSKVAL